MTRVSASQSLLLVWLGCAASACSGTGTPHASARPPAAHVQGEGESAKATPTLDGVRRKGFVQCGVTTGVAGFSAPDAQGQWRGLDVDVCRAIAAAVLGDATKVRFTPLTAAQRFTALQTGEIDVLSRITTITFQRDVQLGIEFPAINWYDGTGFIVRKALNVPSVKDLDGATICMQPGTTNELDVADYFRKNHLTFTPVVIERLEEATNAYFAGRCDAFSQDRSTLAAVRARAPNPDDHVVLSELISKAPYGPGVMSNDLRWLEIVRWSVFAMIDAEELGLSSRPSTRRSPATIPTCSASSARPAASARCSASTPTGPSDRQTGRQLRRELRSQHQAARHRARPQPAVEGRRRPLRPGSALTAAIRAHRSACRHRRDSPGATREPAPSSGRSWSPRWSARYRAGRGPDGGQPEAARHRVGVRLSQRAGGVRDRAGPRCRIRRATPMLARWLSASSTRSGSPARHRHRNALGR